MQINFHAMDVNKYRYIQASIGILIFRGYRSCLHCTMWGTEYRNSSHLTGKKTEVNDLKFWTLVACQKGLDKQCRPRSDCFWRSSLIRVLPVCCSDKHFVNSSPYNQQFIWDQKEKSVRNFVTFTTPWLSRDMRFPTMWYVRPAKPQISQCICTVW